jgi:hypothetical protein
LISSSSSSSLSLTDDSSENNLESSDSDFSPLLSDSEHREIEEFILNGEDDNIKDITSKMMKCTLVPGLKPNNTSDNRKHNNVQNNNISEELNYNDNNIQNNNNFSDKTTDDVFEDIIIEEEIYDDDIRQLRSFEESEPFIEPYINSPEVIKEKDDDNNNQQRESLITNTSKIITSDVPR